MFNGLASFEYIDIELRPLHKQMWCEMISTPYIFSIEN